MGMVPRPGQPCFRRDANGGTVFMVVLLDADEDGLYVGVRPAGARRGSKVTTMSLNTWRTLFEVPEPPV